MVREAKKVTAKEEELTVVGAPTGVIYADRILNVGFGPGVSRLTLAMEVGVNTFNPIATLVIPTPGLIEALEFILKEVNENDEMKNGIVQSLDAFKVRLSKS